MKDKTLPNARQSWLLAKVKSFKLEAPVAEIHRKTGKSVGAISNFLSGKRLATDDFIQNFCESFEIDYKTAQLEIEEIAKSLSNKEIAPSNLEFEEADPVIHYSSDLNVKPSKPKEVQLIGKHKPLRLKPEEYAEAFGDWAGLPMYNTPITATFVETYRDESIYTPQYYLHDPRFRDCDFGAIITGDSMHSEIRHGDFVACKEVIDRRFLVYGDIYYVVASNGLETCKYVNADPNNPDVLLLVPKNDKLSPSPLPKDMLIRLYKVRGIVRGY